MHPQLRNSLLIALGLGFAFFGSLQLAGGSWFWPMLGGFGLLGLSLVYLTKLRLETLCLALGMAGYLLGNRGFAQQMLPGSLPLLPAEAILAVTVPLLFLRVCIGRAWPGGSGSLPWLVGGWALLATLRLPLDLRHYGLYALRDYALVYYTAFFFVASAVGQVDRDRRALERTLTACLAAMPVLYFAYDFFPEFFWTRLTLQHMPLIAFKPDLVSTFAAVGVVRFYLLARRGDRYSGMYWLACTINALVVGHALGRSTLVALAVAAIWLWVARERIFVLCLASALALLLAGSALMTSMHGSAWKQTTANSLYEHIISIGDLSGQGDYTHEDALSKGDNNRFRLVWWREILRETWATNPWLGLGWGYDLSAQFTRAYFEADLEDFSTRSPHNVLFTVFGRTGLLGLVPFAFVIAGLARHTVAAVRRHRTQPDDPTAMADWLGVWVVLVCACFGVVLEGPMGAVVFWTLLGMANATPSSEADHAAASATAEPVAAGAPPAPA